MNPAYLPLIEKFIEYITAWFSKRKKIRDLILPLIESAAKDGNLPDNVARREWVVNYLITEKEMSESSARLLVEAGLKLYKKITAKKAAADAKKNPPAA